LSLWTQLRHLSHIDRKEEAKSSVGKAAAGGIQGVSTAWAVNASSVTYFSLPTLRNLACMPPSVNHLDELGCADGLHSWLPGLGTFGAQKAGFGSLLGLHRSDDCAYPQQSGYRRKPFIRSGIDIGDAIVRDSSNRPLSMSGRTCPSGPVPFNPLPQKLRALLLPSNTSHRIKEPYEFSRRNRRSAQTVFGWWRHCSQQSSSGRIRTPCKLFPQLLVVEINQRSKRKEKTYGRYRPVEAEVFARDPDH
jgi:hypothetical protein